MGKVTDKILDCQSPVGQVGKTDSVIRDKKDALEEFDRFCRFIDGINMNGFVENDFMSKKIQKKIRAALIDEPTKPSFRVPHEGYPFDAAIKGYGAPPKTTDDCHLTTPTFSGDMPEEKRHAAMIETLKGVKESMVQMIGVIEGYKAHFIEPFDEYPGEIKAQEQLTALNKLIEGEKP